MNIIKHWHLFEMQFFLCSSCVWLSFRRNHHMSKQSSKYYFAEEQYLQQDLNTNALTYFSTPVSSKPLRWNIQLISEKCFFFAVFPSMEEYLTNFTRECMEKCREQTVWYVSQNFIIISGKDRNSYSLLSLALWYYFGIKVAGGGSR